MENPKVHRSIKQYRFPAVLLIVSAFVLSCMQSVEINKKQMEDARRLGVEYLNRGKYTLALRTLLEAEKIYAKDAVLQNNLGYAYMAKRKYDLAIEHFNKALGIKSDYSEVRNNIGVAHMYKKEWDKAIPYFEAVAQDLLYNTPQYPLLNLGWAYFNKKDYARSEQYYLEALEIKPKFVDALHGLGRTYLAMGNVEKAVKRLESAVQLVPNSARLYFDLAGAYQLSGSNRKAIDAYGKVIELVPDTPLASAAGKKRSMLKKK